MARDTHIGLVDMNKGDYILYGNTQLSSVDNLVNALYASMSVPGYFTPVQAFGSAFVDGAAVLDIDIPSAINACAAKGFKASDIVVDVVMTVNTHIEEVDTEDFNSFQALFRFLNIARYYGQMDGINRSQFAYPEVTFRYVVGPS